MTFAGEQAGGRIQADPAGTRHEHLGPGVQVGEIGLGAGGAIQGLEIGGQLNQVAGNETGGEAQPPINVIGDTTRAGYNATMMMPAAFNGGGYPANRLSAIAV